MKKILLSTILIFITFGTFAPSAFATRLHTTGFETQSVTDENLTNTSLSNALVINTSIKRTGSASLTLNGTITASTPNGSRYIYPAATASTTLRFYFYVSSYPDAATTIAAITGASPFTNRAYLKLATNGALQLFDSSGAQIGSNSPVVNLNGWTRVELKHYNGVLDNTGTIEAKLDGRTFASSDAADTASTGGAFTLGINLASEGATSGSWYYDDVALNNNSGTTQTGYPGAGAVVNLYPNDTGDFAEGASNGAGVGWNDIDDAPSDGDTTYWQLQSTNDRLDVNVTNASTAGIIGSDVITLVQVNAIVRNDAAAGSTFATRLKSVPSGTVLQSSNVTMGSDTWSVNDDGTDKTGRVVALTDTETGARWTPQLLDTIQIGITAPDADPDMYVTAMWAAVEYTPIPQAPHRINLPNGRIMFTNGRILIK